MKEAHDEVKQVTAVAHVFISVATHRNTQDLLNKTGDIVQRKSSIVTHVS